MSLSRGRTIFERVDAGDGIALELLLEIHQRLLAGTRLEPYAGRFFRVLDVSSPIRTELHFLG